MSEQHHEDQENCRTKSLGQKCPGFCLLLVLTDEFPFDAAKLHLLKIGFDFFLNNRVLHTFAYTGLNRDGAL